jgi:predicted nucleic acid-binding protein
MNAVFVDTSFYVAFANPDDQWHNTAVAAGGRKEVVMFTTEFVLVELGNCFCGTAFRPVFMRMAKMIQEDEATRVVPATSGLLQAGMDLFGKRPDKSWSLTDCISFAFMESMGIVEALTCDHHFEQAGFRALMIQAGLS